MERTKLLFIRLEVYIAIHCLCLCWSETGTEKIKQMADCPGCRRLPPGFERVSFASGDIQNRMKGEFRSAESKSAQRERRRHHQRKPDSFHSVAASTAVIAETNSHSLTKTIWLLQHPGRDEQRRRLIRIVGGRTSTGVRNDEKSRKNVIRLAEPATGRMLGLRAATPAASGLLGHQNSLR